VERHQNYAESASHSTKKTRIRPQIDNVFVCNVFWIQVSKLEWCNGIHQRRQRKPQSPSGCYIQSRLGWRPESGDRDHGRTKPSAPAGGPRRVGSRGVRFSGRLVLGVPGHGWRGHWPSGRGPGQWGAGSRGQRRGRRGHRGQSHQGGKSRGQSHAGKVTRAKSRGMDATAWIRSGSTGPWAARKFPAAVARPVAVRSG
jgi:hypothetical protein